MVKLETKIEGYSKENENLLLAETQANFRLQQGYSEVEKKNT